MQPTPERFRALARSSPWRWSTLQFTLAFRGRRQWDPVRAWLRRYDALRIENLDGVLLHVVHQAPATTVSVTDGVESVFLKARPNEVPPTYDADGLVAHRPGRRAVEYDDPMWQTYHWVAMLDPVELTDGRDGAAGAVIQDVREVHHHGRRAWEAIATPTDAYDPRCSCCPLMLSEVSDALEAQAGGPTVRTFDPAFDFAPAHRLRLDVETGVLVYGEQIGGTRSGESHEVVIEAVDEPMPDELFPVSPHGQPPSPR